LSWGRCRCQCVVSSISCRRFCLVAVGFLQDATIDSALVFAYQLFRACSAVSRATQCISVSATAVLHVLHSFPVRAMPHAFPSWSAPESTLKPKPNKKGEQPPTPIRRPTAAIREAHRAHHRATRLEQLSPSTHPQRSFPIFRHPQLHPYSAFPWLSALSTAQFGPRSSTNAKTRRPQTRHTRDQTHIPTDSRPPPRPRPLRRVNRSAVVYGTFFSAKLDVFAFVFSGPFDLALRGLFSIFRSGCPARMDSAV
jgi:hypothetical protein